MVITFVCDVLGEENNGTTIATMNVARAMKDKGHEVRIVCCDKEHRGQEGYFIVPEMRFGPFAEYVRHNGVNPASGRDLTEVKKALEGSDVVHFNFCGGLSKKVVRLCKELHMPTTASLHTQAENFTNHLFLDHSRTVNNAAYRLLFRTLFKQVDAIHFPSQFIHDYFQEKTHFKNKAYVISNGIQKSFVRMPTERPKDWQGKIVITYTARYSREKAHKELFQAVALSQYKNDILLVLPGAGPLKKKFEKYGKKYCVNPPVLGFHSREKMVEILNSTDIYCHVGRVDIEPVSCLEAISVGVAPVLTDSPVSAASSFAMTEHNVYRHGDPKSLSKAIDYWIEHPKERQENADGYLGFADRFDFDEAMEKMEAMWRETIQAKKATQ